MATRKILVIGGPRENILHAKAKKVSRFDAYLEKLVSDMWETMRAAPGVGLAAPQIGESIRVLVAEYEDEAVALVNPEILEAEGEELATEACLSIPGYVGDNVPRATRLVVKARDPKGKQIKVRAEGWFARILQHEMDHLDGILYTDRISPEFVREAGPDEVVEEAEALIEPAGGGVARVEKNAHPPADRDGSKNAPAAKSAKTATPAATSPASQNEGAAKTANPVTTSAKTENESAATSATPAASSTTPGGRP